MAVGVDATGTTLVTLGTSWNYTGLTIVSASALVFEVVVNTNGTNYTTATRTATWDNGGSNQAMTLVGIAGDPATSVYIEYWGLVSPTAGNKTLHYTTTLSLGAAVCNAISLTGTQTTFASAFPTGHFSSVSANNSSAPTFAVTSATGNMAFGAYGNVTLSDGDPLTSPSGATEWLHDTSGSINTDGYHAAGAATVTFTFTAPSSVQNYVGAGIDVVAAGSTCPHTLTTLGVGCGIWAAKKLEENPIVTRRGLLLPRGLR